MKHIQIFFFKFARLFAISHWIEMKSAIALIVHEILMLDNYENHKSITMSYLETGTGAVTTPCSALLYRISPLPHFYHQTPALPLCSFPSCWLLLGDCQADSGFLCMQTQTVQPQLTFFCIFKLCAMSLRKYHFE